MRPLLPIQRQRSSYPKVDFQISFKKYLNLIDSEAKLKATLNDAIADLDKKVLARYKTITETEIKTLVVDDKWMTTIERDIKIEMERVSQGLTHRIKELTERYEMPLPKLSYEVGEMEDNC